MPSLEIKISTNVRYLSHKKHSFYFLYLSIDFIFILKFEIYQPTYDTS